jgi:hypothetical protein
MKTVLSTLAAWFIVAGSLTAQQNPQTPPTPQKEPVDVILTGCLVQGSGPDVFLFDNAKKDPKSTTEKGERYLIVAGTEDLPLRANLNHEVQMTGKITTKPALPAGQKPTEKDLSVFATRSVTLVSDTCGAAKR